jgi:sulfur carrier protein
MIAIRPFRDVNIMANRIILNGAPTECITPLSLSVLIESLHLDPLQVAVEVDRVVIPRACHPDFQLCGGESVEVVTLVGGG